MNVYEPEVDDEPEPDTAMYFYVFMIVFWPVSIVLGLIGFYYVKEYDLRLVTLLLGLGAGWLAVRMYKVRERKRHDAAS